MENLPLTPDILLKAYINGVFPMDVDGSVQWFSPDPRAIIPLDRFHASKTTLQTYRNGRFEIRVDTAFEPVMRECGRRAEGTWISEEIIAAYCRLHELGYAHSVEAWDEDTLAGGLYGVAVGGAFFGESMFHRKRDASKVALVALVERMRSRGFALLDTQFITPHLARFGALEIPRDAYLRRLWAAVQIETSLVDDSSDTIR
jgi:leucyl/phenylalanyl-tRNA--protein transferase